MREAQLSGLSPGEIAEAVHLFRVRAANSRSGCKQGRCLTIEDVDILLRQLRLFMPMRFLWALFQEIDKNCNGKIEITAFAIAIVVVCCCYTVFFVTCYIYY